MANRHETLMMAETVVINAESRYINEMIDDYERRSYISEDYADHTVDQIMKEEERLRPEGKYDHEEVYVATGEYTVGRID